MSDYEKTSRAYLEAWRTSQAEMQKLRDLLDAERERVRVLRDTIREVLPLVDGTVFGLLDCALATTEGV